MATKAAAQHRLDTMNLRVSPELRTLIDRAADAVGKNRTEFVLEAARREAGTVLADQRYFVLDEHAYQRFNDALDRTPAENPKLRALLTSKAPWEK